ncbi:MAG: leucyl/phenylalanyl-tRNA--protein transferase, partial [Bacteroidota bacterium]|nr:leucyl/phenylalanyl-tRNA--protein transferase [Bacteroidota bacterium]
MPHSFFSEKEFYFPPVSDASDDGLLIIGGEPTPARVLEAYTKGIFPWYSEGEWPQWWSPDPRFILLPNDLHISRSMKRLMSKNVFDFAIDTAFENVISACASAKRKEQNGTWITPEIKETYTQLHYSGYAHSAEAWKNGELVGGMYGILLGNVFFGESMFSKVANASKFAFITYVRQLQQTGVQLIDCQVFSAHVESLGGL